MWESKLKFKNPGLQTLILDQGRKGLQSYSIPRGGVMDTQSATIANKLVGNPDDYPILELTLIGPKIEVTGDIYIAVTGAPIPFKINGESKPAYETIHVSDGSSITFGSINEGMRSYLAIGGDWKIASWLRSVSLIPNYNIPILNGNGIQKSSELSITTKQLVKKRICPESLKFSPRKNLKIRILKGPEFDLLDQSCLDFFLNHSFTIHKNSNRMAISFEENFSDYQPNKELISSANILGTIQLTNEGKPLILLNDAGTTGGYPRIGNVISADFPILAQAKHNSKINFELVDIDLAQRSLAKQKDLLLSVL